jgi:hypothetical protein
MSVLFNADDESSSVVRSALTQDFRAVHSVCWVIFMSLKEVKFSQGNTFIYMNHEWEAVSFKRMVSTGYVYSILGYPKEVCTVVETSHNNLSGLAASVNIKLAENSGDPEFEFPLKNVLLGPLLYKYRYESLEQNRDDPGKALFLFYDQRGLFGKTYSDLVKEEIIEFSPGILGRTLSYSFVNDSPAVQYKKDHHPRRYEYKNWLRLLFGQKVDCQGGVYSVIGAHHKLTTGEEDVGKLDKMVLLRQKFDSSKNPQPWALTFGRLEV